MSGSGLKGHQRKSAGKPMVVPLCRTECRGFPVVIFGSCRLFSRILSWVLFQVCQFLPKLASNIDIEVPPTRRNMLLRGLEVRPKIGVTLRKPRKAPNQSDRMPSTHQKHLCIFIQQSRPKESHEFQHACSVQFVLDLCVIYLTSLYSA